MITNQSSSRYIAIVVAATECFFFGGLFQGWPSLVYLIKQDGIYRYLCVNNSTNTEYNLPERSSTEDSGSQEVCFEEEATYNLALSVGQLFRFLGFLPAAFIVDRFGTKASRLLGCLAVVSGGLMLGFCTKDRPYLLIPGCSLVGICNPLYMMSNVQIANIFRKAKATILSILAAAQTAAGLIFLSFKFLSDYAGIRWNTSFTIWGSSALLTLIPTFFLFPKILSKSSVEESENAFSSDNANCRREEDEQIGRMTNGLREKANYNSIEKNESKYQEAEPLMKSLLSVPFIIHCYAIAIYNINSAVYNGSFSWWINEVTDDKSVVSSLTNILGFMVIIKIVLATSGGMLMDYIYNKYEKENRDVRKAGFYPLLLVAAAYLGLIISTMVKTISAVIVSILFMPLCQATYIASAFCYTRARFPKHHYNRIIGILHLIASIESTVQYLLFRLMMSEEMLVRVILLVLVGISFLDPFHLLCLRKKNI